MAAVNIDMNKCSGCGGCVGACPEKALSMPEIQKPATDKNEWRNILVYVEIGEDGIHPVSFQLISKAAELAGQAGCRVYGVIIGRGAAEKTRQLKGCALAKVFCYDDVELRDFRANVYAAALADCIGLLKPSVVLVGSTPQGKSVAPVAAVMLRTGLTADCTGLEMRPDGGLVQVRPAFGGNIMAQIVTPDSRPQFATVRCNVMAERDVHTEAMPDMEIRALPFGIRAGMWISASEKAAGRKDISAEDVVIAAGRGVRNRGDLEMLEELASLLGGQLACTRGLVEKGFMPQEKQIGISGKAVRPKALIAFGISGSVQFMAGITGAKTVIAVNNDPRAGIMSAANYPICGDLYEIVPAMIKKLRDSAVR